MKAVSIAKAVFQIGESGHRCTRGPKQKFQANQWCVCGPIAATRLESRSVTFSFGFGLPLSGKLTYSS